MDEEDHARVKDRMEEASKLLKQQEEMDSMRYGLCDLLAKKKASLGITKVVKDLEDTNPSLFKYIRTMEFLQELLGCPTCIANSRKVSAENKADAWEDITAQQEKIICGMGSIEQDIARLSKESRLLAELGSTLADEPARTAAPTIEDAEPSQKSHGKRKWFPDSQANAKARASDFNNKVNELAADIQQLADVAAALRAQVTAVEKMIAEKTKGFVGELPAAKGQKITADDLLG